MGLVSSNRWVEPASKMDGRVAVQVESHGGGLRRVFGALHVSHSMQSYILLTLGKLKYNAGAGAV
jgi:hypothetical protein